MDNYYVIEVINEDGVTEEQRNVMQDIEGVRFAGCFDAVEKTAGQ